MGFLKNESRVMLFDRHTNLKYRYGKRNFWTREYFADTVEQNEKVIKEYIKNSWKKYKYANKSTQIGSIVE